MAKVGDKTSKGVVKSTRKGVAVAYKGDGVSSSSRGGGSKKTGNAQVDAINAAREANIAAGRSAYSGAGATAASAAKGKGGYDPKGDYSNLPDFGNSPGNTEQRGVATTYEQASQNLQKGGLTGQALTDAQKSLSGAYGVPGGAQAPVATPAATPTPTQNRYQAGLAAAQASGLPAPADAGAARTQASSYLPTQTQDTSVVDNIFSQDPVIGQLMGGIAELLSSKNQVPSIMEDYKKLRKQSGLDDINEELIDAETILDGTEDDVRNEIQTAGGLGTESQVQAMTLSRNKNLLKRYNQLVQMKTDATNQLNTMLTLTQQDRQMAQERMTTQINTMFNMANFRQTALQNTRQQQQFMLQVQGADGYYASVSKDPRQLAMAEQIMGISPGGLQAMAAQAAQEKARKANLEERQIRVAESSAAAQWENVNLAREKLAIEKEEIIEAAKTAKEAAVAKGEIVLNKIGTAQGLLKGVGGAFSSGFFGGLTKGVGGSVAKDLDTTLDTIRAQLAFEELSKMRAASPTGGALGNVTERELALLSATAGSLDVGQSASQLKANLTSIDKQYTSILNKMGYGVASNGEVYLLPQ